MGDVIKTTGWVRYMLNIERELFAEEMSRRVMAYVGNTSSNDVGE